MKTFIALLALSVPSLAFAQPLQPATGAPVVEVVVPVQAPGEAPLEPSSIGKQATQGTTSPLTAWSATMSPTMNKEVAREGTLPERCIVSPDEVKKDGPINFGTCNVPLKDATQTDPNSKKGEDHSPPLKSK